MTDILHSPTHIPSPPSSNDVLQHHQQSFVNHDASIINSSSRVASCRRSNNSTSRRIQEVEGCDHHFSAFALLFTVFRRSLIGCRDTSASGVEVEEQQQLMEIGLPTNVRHVVHVTFDRFNGFLGLPVEFEPDVPRKPPSASTRVFGVSTESMQLSFDSRGNCVPTILLMMQRRLYSQGGLEFEGIFRINPENGQEEYVREQLNNGMIPENIDVHCLAGLIKAWFRELPHGILDSLPPEEVMQAESEDDCVHLVRRLPPTESALLDWAINLMADAAQMENLNKMNARNVAMVFAPNMTKMSDPLTALMFAVQAMNFLKTLIVKTLRERQDSVIDTVPSLDSEPSDKDSNPSAVKLTISKASEVSGYKKTTAQAKEPAFNEPNTPISLSKSSSAKNSAIGIENCIPDESGDPVNGCSADISSFLEGGCDNISIRNEILIARSRRTKSVKPSKADDDKEGSGKQIQQPETAEKKKRLDLISHLNLHAVERVEAWR